MMPRGLLRLRLKFRKQFDLSHDGLRLRPPLFGNRTHLRRPYRSSSASLSDVLYRHHSDYPRTPTSPGRRLLGDASFRTLHKAIRATFERRQTELSVSLYPLSDAFAAEAEKQTHLHRIGRVWKGGSKGFWPNALAVVEKSLSAIHGA
jgi:hypothetical protein